MRKIVLVLIMAVVISAGAFAEHPSGWGVGLVGQGGRGWGGDMGGGPALSLKAPHSPVYWGINLGIRRNLFSVSVNGDFLLLDNTINRDLNLGWFFGLGAYAGIHNYKNDSESWIALQAGARAPVGIYFFPVKFLEIFFDLAPGLGLGVYLGAPGGIEFPEGGIDGEFGIRFWF